MLLYLILVAQFRSFTDPFLILLPFSSRALRECFSPLYSHWHDAECDVADGDRYAGGITMSDSILIVEFAHHLLDEGTPVSDAVTMACRVRLRPILMTTLATIIGLLPMALKFEDRRSLRTPCPCAGWRAQRFGILHRAGGDGGVLPGLPKPLCPIKGCKWPEINCCIAFQGARAFEFRDEMAARTNDGADGVSTSLGVASYASVRKRRTWCAAWRLAHSQVAGNPSKAMSPQRAR